MAKKHDKGNPTKNDFDSGSYVVRDDKSWGNASNLTVKIIAWNESILKAYLKGLKKKKNLPVIVQELFKTKAEMERLLIWAESHPEYSKIKAARASKIVARRSKRKKKSDSNMSTEQPTESKKKRNKKRREKKQKIKQKRVESVHLKNSNNSDVATEENKPHDIKRCNCKICRKIRLQAAEQTTGPASQWQDLKNKNKLFK